MLVTCNRFFFFLNLDMSMVRTSPPILTEQKKKNVLHFVDLLRFKCVFFSVKGFVTLLIQLFLF